MSISNNLKIRGAAWKDYDIARLQISVGQAYHEGSHLFAAVQWVAENFEKAIVCVNDTLQRYNGPGSEEAGRMWIERNNDILNALPNVEIIRWDHWLNHPDFQDLHAGIKDRYRSDLVFRRVIDNESMCFATRRKPMNMGAFLERSKAYLLEECAAFQIMFKTPAADIYPGSTLIPCQVLKGDKGKGFTRVELSRSSFLQKAANQA